MNTAIEVKRTALSAKTNISNRLVQDTAKLTLKSKADEDDLIKPKLQKCSNNANDKGKIVKIKKISDRENKKPIEKSNSNELKPNYTKVVSKIPRLNSKSIEEKVVRENIILVPSFSTNMLPPNVENIDEDEENNILLTTEYVNDIYIYLRSLESKQSIKPNFLAHQKEMTPRMRSVLVDWIINVHFKFRLLPETLYMAVAIMDRFFEKEIVVKDKIQLVGTTALLIASKFEEIYPPDVQDLVVICDHLYNKRDILKMEISILKTLKFQLGRPLPLHFLRRNSKAAHADAKIHTLAKYLMELSLVEYECAHWNPSILAASALYVTLKLIGDSSDWTPTLTFYSNYTEQEIIPYASILCKIILKAPKSKFQTSRSKYSSIKFHKISILPELESQIVKDLTQINSSKAG